MKRTSTSGQAVRILALALPLLALAALVGTNSGSALAAAVSVAAALVTPPVLNFLATRATRRLGSASLPRRVWIAVTCALWLGITGALAMGQHFLSVQAGAGELLFLQIAGAAWLGATVSVLLSLVFAVAMTVRLIASPRPAEG
ncbi:hypothetical protein LLS1_12570 [Leifsonia sp. LS1]|uniref:hypothetical protein n=1 Tax=Leifsonia sp. LS1 TaxID=2828483 RepID=UPI001CFDE647|nr:hypothetical protein [Leifsonia sp. LS1]GIT79588.1 hypothetical protein LLS1_12570 [Leifsonia sp. LS1]